MKSRLPEDRLACELSGGLDSSTVTALAHELDPDLELHTFSNSICEADKGKVFPFVDETELSDELCAKYGLKNYKVDDQGRDFVGQLQEVLKLFPYPSCMTHVMSINTYRLAKEKACKVIFSGFGGDEGVSYRNKCLHGRELFRKGRWIYAYKELSKLSYSPLQIMKQWIRSYIPKRGTCSEGLSLLNTDCEDWSRDASHLEWRKNSREYAVYKLCHEGFVAERLEQSYHIAGLYEVEYRYPLLDVRLLEYFIALPTEYKCRDGVTRYFLREATRDLLPDSIRLRDEKTVSMMPSYFRLTMNAVNKNVLPQLDPLIFDVQKIAALQQDFEYKIIETDFPELELFWQAISYQLYANGVEKEG